MYLKNIKLKNFRNYSSIDINFYNGINILYGKNGNGKTNLLEAIYFLALTKSHRTFVDNNLIKNSENFLFVKGEVLDNDIPTILEVYMKDGKKILKKDNNLIRRITDYINTFNIIIFHPDDLEIIKGSPDTRRRFLNIEISQVYTEYLDIIANYNKILKIRNNYLKEKNIDSNYLDVITDKLTEISIQIYLIRNKYIQRINDHISKIYKDLAETNGLKINYKTSIDIDFKNTDNLKDKLKDFYNSKLENDIKYGTTRYGPHKDDFEFTVNGKNLKFFGSQGQQRMAILAFKLSEIEILLKYKNKKPIILLDDVFSELDLYKKNNLLKFLDRELQIIITTTDLDNIDKKIIEKARNYKIENGTYIEEVE